MNGYSELQAKAREEYATWVFMNFYPESLCHLARRQLELVKMCCCISILIRHGGFTYKESQSQQRWLKSILVDVLAYEMAMTDYAWRRDEDIEEFTNSDLVGAIHALTASRINRMAYAGRRLP